MIDGIEDVQKIVDSFASEARALKRMFAAEAELTVMTETANRFANRAVMAEGMLARVGESMRLCYPFHADDSRNLGPVYVMSEETYLEILNTLNEGVE